MNDEERAKLEQAWKQALDRDVLRALKTPEDYAPEAYAVVQAEAAARGLGADTELPATEAPFPLLRRAFERAKPAMLAIARFPPAHPLMAACLLGVSLIGSAPLLTLIVGYPSWLPVWWILPVGAVLYIGGIAWICWPCRSYATPPLVALTAWFCNTLPRVTDLLDTMGQSPGRALLMHLLLPLGYLVGGGSLVLSLVVFIRRQLWPIYPAHQCEKCGYDLRGLPEPRCPECGTTFVPASDDDDVVLEA